MKKIYFYYFIVISLLALILLFNLASLWEAYGPGEPYYGRSTNMDKWSDPRPLLLAVDGGAALVVFGLRRLFRRRS